MDQPSTSKRARYERYRPLSQKELEKYVADFIEEEDKISDHSDQSEIDELYISDHDTQTEASADEEEPTDPDEDIPLAQLGYFVGKDNTKWQKAAPPSSRTRHYNIFTGKPGPKGTVKNAVSVVDTWSVMITEEILQLIVQYTNIYIQTQKDRFSRERDARETNIGEIKALIGLLYHAGTLKSAKLNTKDLWAKDGSGIDIFIATMCRKRFLFLLKCLRFDNVLTRFERRETDKLAPIREIAEIFKKNIMNSFTIGEFATIDEKLESFRGRCSFRQYIKNKPAKYGIKIFLLTDARNFYTCNFEIYVGQQPEGPFRTSNDAASVVLRLIEPVDNTGRNITIDNWFTSIPLVENLLLNHKTTCVGTLRKNKREIPAKFTATKGRERCSSMFGFSTCTTLVSYTPKPNKIVLLVSTLHHDNAINISSGASKKPEIISFYNSTKGGVDMVDQLCGTYSVSRKSRRWPLTIFFGLLNIAGINGYVIHKTNNIEAKQLLRRHYLKQLSLSLTKAHLEERVKTQTLPTNVKSRIKLLLPEDATQPSTSNRIFRATGRCEDCGNKKDRKTSTTCKSCSKLVCREHVTPICGACFEAHFNNENL